MVEAFDFYDNDIGRLLEEDGKRPNPGEQAELYDRRFSEEGQLSRQLPYKIEKLLDISSLLFEGSNFSDGEDHFSHLEFGINYAYSIIEMFEAHDEGRITDSYNAAGEWIALTFDDIPTEEAFEAGYCYVDALRKKDRIEENFRDENGKLQPEKMAENDGFDVSNIVLDHGNQSEDRAPSVEFEEEDLGLWSEVYKSHRGMSSNTVEPFLGKDTADYEALLRTLSSFRNHKVGCHSETEWDYWDLIGRAQNAHFSAALQNESYPEKHSEDGSHGNGYLAEMRSPFIEIHDQYRVEGENYMKWIAFGILVGNGYRLSRKREN